MLSLCPHRKDKISKQLFQVEYVQSGFLSGFLKCLLDFISYISKDFLAATLIFIFFISFLLCLLSSLLLFRSSKSCRVSQGNDCHERSCMCDKLGGSCVVIGSTAYTDHLYSWFLPCSEKLTSSSAARSDRATISMSKEQSCVIICRRADKRKLGNDLP